MSVEAWNKIQRTHNIFKKIVAPLKAHLSIDFGYMIVFNDGRYFQIIENLECLQKWVNNVVSQCETLLRLFCYDLKKL